MESKILALREELAARLAAAADATALDEVRVAFLGKRGSVTELLKGLRDLSVEEKKEAGGLINRFKAEAEDAITAAGERMKQAALEESLKNAKHYNPSLPRLAKVGSYHPITLVRRSLERIFAGMGFTVEDYQEIVDDYQCFESLNIPKHHPARDMQDTYYLENGQLLKTQTSAAQNAIMKKYGAPLRAIFPGRCFRNEATDACHENTFSRWKA